MGQKSLFWMIGISIIIQTDLAYSMGVFRSRDQNSSEIISTPPPYIPPTPTPTPTPTPPQIPIPSPLPETTPYPNADSQVNSALSNATENFTPILDFDFFRQLADPIGNIVDNYYRSYRELMPERNNYQAHNSDFCSSQPARTRFIDQLAFFVTEHLVPSRPRLTFIASSYSLPSDLNSFFPVSLASHPMCPADANSLGLTISKVPDAATIKKVNLFIDRYNSLRELALQERPGSGLALAKLWTQFMSCLAYTESLSSADSSRSIAVAEKYAPPGYQKPSGVEFYEDPLQNEASRLNIGLFQFTPTSSGNINPCLHDWNEQYPACPINSGGNQAEMIKLVGSSYQSFNSYCGTNKILQSFAVQINTSDESRSHPNNQESNGLLKSPQNRCITPFFKRSYNHFGPLQNSTGTNLNSVITCALKDM